MRRLILMATLVAVSTACTLTRTPNGTYEVVSWRYGPSGGSLAEQGDAGEWEFTRGDGVVYSNQLLFYSADPDHSLFVPVVVPQALSETLKWSTETEAFLTPIHVDGFECVVQTTYVEKSNDLKLRSDECVLQIPAADPGLNQVLWTVELDLVY